MAHITVRVLSIYFMSIFIVNEAMACPLPEKEILYLLMKNYDVPLSVDSSCKNAGTEKTDKTIGEYFSGFWADHTKRTGKNWIEVKSKSIDRNQCEARVEIYRKHGEEVIGGWGVLFVVDNASRKVDRTSFRCPGSG